MKRKSKNDTRPGWDEYFMEIAQVVAKRSNCSRRKVAAVITKENHLLSTGYNGTPRGVKNCFDGGCPRCAGKTPSGKGLDECLCVHAEQNAICQAARYGVNVSGGCLTCAKLIINSGISEVVYGGDYTAFLDTVKEMFRQAGVKCRSFALKEMP